MDASVRILQLQPTHGYLSMGKMLKTMGIQQCGLYRLCDEEKETIIHLFRFCREAVSFWTEVEKWVSRDCKKGQNVNNIMMGKLCIFKVQMTIKYWTL